MGLPKEHRLKSWREFRLVYQKGSKRYSSHLILRALPVSGSELQSLDPSTLVGISISTKVSKKAVQRNLIKRRIKAAIRELLPRMNHGWLIVVVVKTSAIKCSYGDFLRELEQLFKQSSIINGH